MSALPFEILTSIFKLSRRNDLKQCQLVCRSWNQASLEILYSHVNLDSEEQCRLYLRTIKRDPRRGKYLEIIRASVEEYYDEDDSDSEDDEGKMLQFNNWDRNGLLNTVIDLCPNVLKILNDEPSTSFWKKLMDAASRGQLSRLQYLNNPGRLDFYHYANTVLAFKKSLNTLEIPDSVSKELSGAELYPVLRENLNQFPCLQNLEIDCCSKHQLSYYDTIVNYCEGLTSLIIHPVPFKSQLIVVKALEKTIKPHPKIETLVCTWPIVNAEDQVTYIMRKFPNLKSLAVKCDRHGRNGAVQFSADTLLKFLKFVIRLKKSDVSVILNLENRVNPWVTIINEKLSAINIRISIFAERHNNSKAVLTQYFTGNTLSFSFSSYTHHHIKLLSDIGKKVRSLSLRIRMAPPDNVTNIDKIIEMTKLCPSLQHLKLEYLQKFLCSDNIDYQNFEMKSLTLCTYDHTIGSLKELSFIFPNLKKLELFFSDRYDTTETITIDMPNTSLDILRCGIRDTLFEYVAMYYVRLKSDAGLQFFSVTTSKMRQINEVNITQLHFDINCRSLTKIEIDKIVMKT